MRPAARFMAATATLLSVIAASPALYSQDLVWTVSYGGLLNEDGYAGCLTSDGGLAVLGSTFSYGAGDYDLYLLRLDSLGDTLWSATYGGPEADQGYDIQQTADGGFILVGKSKSFGAGDADVFLLKVDFLGGETWSKTFGDTGRDEGWSVRQTSDLGYIIAGRTNSRGAGADDFYLVKTDAAGDTLWSQTFGGANGESAMAVRATLDDGYIVFGTTGSFGQGYSSMYAVKTDGNGDSLWTATYGGDMSDLGYAVEITPDGGFVFAGATASFGAGYSDMYLVKTDPSGTQEWDKYFGGTEDDRAYSVQVTPDGGYLVAGRTQSYGSGQYDMYAVRTDPLGFPNWTKTYGGTKSDYCRSALTAPDGFILVGYTYSFSSGGSDSYLVRLTDDQVTSVDDLDLFLPRNFELAQNYPNPFNLSTVIEFSVERRDNFAVTVFNILGQEVRHWNLGSLPTGRHTVTWNGLDEFGREVASGVYLYRLSSNDQQSTRKMVLLK